MIKALENLDIRGPGSVEIKNIDILQDALRGGESVEESVMLLSFYNPEYLFYIRGDIRQDAQVIMWRPRGREDHACPTCGCISGREVAQEGGGND